MNGFDYNMMGFGGVKGCIVGYMYLSMRLDCKLKTKRQCRFVSSLANVLQTNCSLQKGRKY